MAQFLLVYWSPQYHPLHLLHKTVKSCTALTDHNVCLSLACMQSSLIDTGSQCVESWYTDGVLILGTQIARSTQLMPHAFKLHQMSVQISNCSLVAFQILSLLAQEYVQRPPAYRSCVLLVRVNFKLNSDTVLYSSRVCFQNSRCRDFVF